MRTISYRLDDLKKARLSIGYEGENEHTQVRIDCADVFAEYPNAVATMTIQPPTGTAYPKTVETDGETVVWNVTASDLAANGYGEIQLTFTENNVIVKSVVSSFNVTRSIIGSGTAPDPVADWIEDANEKLAAVDEAIQDAEDAASHAPIIGNDGYWYRWDADQGEYVSTGTKAQGEQGDPGSPGDPTQLIDDTAGAGVTNKTLSADKLEEKFGDVLNAIQQENRIESDIKNNVAQVLNNGYQKYFPEWERGKYNDSGKASDNEYVRSKDLIYLESGTYTVYSSTASLSVHAFANSTPSDGGNLLWKQTGTNTITVTTRHYVGFYLEWDTDNNYMPTGIYAIIPSAVSSAIANAQTAVNKANEVIVKTEYTDGIYHVKTEGTTLYENKGIGSGILIGAVVTMTNDNYAKVLEVPVTAGKSYRMKARVYNNYYLVHFTDANNILIEKTGKNTTGSTQTMVDVIATAPAGATKAYLSGMKNTMILCEELEPYTVRQMCDMRDKPTRGAFCIMEFNVGDWYEGRYRDADHTGIIPADETIYANYMSLFNGIFGRYKPDIAMLNEDARYMCLNTHDDDRAFVGQYLRYQYSGLFQSQDKTDVLNTLASSFPMFDLSVRNFTNTESNMHRNYVKGYTWLNGKKVCIISAHLSSDIDIAKLNATELLNDLQTEDPEYLICCGDFNYDTNVAEIAAFETAGYTISRGNVVYDGHTYGPGDLIVTTSNITVKSVFCDTQKIDASFVEYIDHLPTIAYLEIY